MEGVVKMCVSKLVSTSDHMKYHMFSIDMGGCEIVLGEERLRTLAPILMDFKELTMQFC